MLIFEVPRWNVKTPKSPALDSVANRSHTNIFLLLLWFAVDFFCFKPLCLSGLFSAEGSLGKPIGTSVLLLSGAPVGDVLW